MEQQIAMYNLGERYKRFVAADGNTLNFPNSRLKTGEMGCYTSHFLLLQENLESNQALHVMEDDVLLAACMEQAITFILESGALDTFDIIYTDTSVPTANNYYKTYKVLFDQIVKRNEAGDITEASFQLIDMQDRFFGTTSSFLISPRSIRKLHNLYARELTKGPSVPVDVFIHELTKQNILKVGCIFPFITSLRLDCIINTTIEGRYDYTSVMAMCIGRYSFFIDRDLKECRKYLDEFLPLTDDRHLQVLMHILGFSCTESFVEL